MEFNDVLNRRYSCRAFAAREVEQEKVDRILEAGRIAPTAVGDAGSHQRCYPVQLWCAAAASSWLQARGRVGKALRR